MASRFEMSREELEATAEVMREALPKMYGSSINDEDPEDVEVPVHEIGSKTERWVGPDDLSAIYPQNIAQQIPFIGDTAIIAATAEA